MLNINTLIQTKTITETTTKEENPDIQMTTLYHQFTGTFNYNNKIISINIELTKQLQHILTTKYQLNIFKLDIEDIDTTHFIDNSFNDGIEFNTIEELKKEISFCEKLNNYTMENETKNIILSILEYLNIK